MSTSPTFDTASLALLAERTQYEAWLLETAYDLTEVELFPEPSGDGVIFTLCRVPYVKSFGNSKVTIGDWRPGFLDAGAPLVFITAFKLLDMFMEWVICANDGTVDFRFQQKLARLGGQVLFPNFVESRPWLKERLVALYGELEPLRATVIHERYFQSTAGTVRVSSSKRGVVGRPVEINPPDLRILARTLVATLRYTDGTWCADGLRELHLRHDIDCLVSFHKLPLLGQRRPYRTIVRVYANSPDPTKLDIVSIHQELSSRFPDTDCVFDVRYLVVNAGGRDGCVSFPVACAAATRCPLISR